MYVRSVTLLRIVSLLFLPPPPYLILLGVVLQVLIWSLFLMICILKLFIGNQICIIMVPTGSAGKAFVSELTLLIQSFSDRAAIDCMF